MPTEPKQEYVIYQDMPLSGTRTEIERLTLTRRFSPSEHEDLLDRFCRKYGIDKSKLVWRPVR